MPMLPCRVHIQSGAMARWAVYRIDRHTGLRYRVSGDYYNKPSRAKREAFRIYRDNEPHARHLVLCFAATRQGAYLMTAHDPYDQTTWYTDITVEEA